MERKELFKWLSLFIWEYVYKSLVNPGFRVVVPWNDLGFWEPESNFGVGWLDWVGSVDDVSSDVDAEVSSNGAWLWIEWLGGSEHLSSGLDGIVTLPDHAAHWSWGGVINESLEEWLWAQVSVVLLELLFSWLSKLHGNELESLSLESGDNLSDEASLDSVWLDHDVCSFSWHCSL